jgi:hypothetical protein
MTTHRITITRVTRTVKRPRHRITLTVVYEGHSQRKSLLYSLSLLEPPDNMNTGRPLHRKVTLTLTMQMGMHPTKTSCNATR